MALKRHIGYDIEWKDKEVMKVVKALLHKSSKQIAQDVENDAKRILKSKAKHTSEQGLLSQFEIKESKFKDSFAVICQGSGNWKPPYHASFVELGTYKMQAKPFMRPARKKNLSKAKKMFQDVLNKL